MVGPPGHREGTISIQTPQVQYAGWLYGALSTKFTAVFGGCLPFVDSAFPNGPTHVGSTFKLNGIRALIPTRSLVSSRTKMPKQAPVTADYALLKDTVLPFSPEPTHVGSLLKLRSN